jgi:VCPO second helical-bundle domain
MTNRSRPIERRVHWRPALAAVATVVATSLPVAAALPPGNPVQQWNRIAEDVVVGSGAFQNEGLIYMAYVSAAVYDAVTAIEGGYEPYGFHSALSPGASVDAAVVEAAYTTLRHYFPAQAASLDTWHAEALALIPNGSAKADGQAVGLAAASEIIRLRSRDGRLTPIGVTSTFPLQEPGPGVWRLTPPAFAAPQTPWVRAVQPFVLTRPSQFHPEPPPPLESQRWVDEFNEMREYGSSVSGVRTVEQTAVARFWTANVIRQYNLLGRELSTNRALDLVQTARLLAMINVVGADAQISVMHWKYEFLFWRPVTAIDPFAVIADSFGPVPGFEDGNARTFEEAGWRPLIATPNHPEYPAAHGSITSAVAEVLTEFLGTSDIDVVIHGFDASGPAGNLNATRHFETATQLRDEIVNARLWAGVHYRGSSEAGVHLGRKVAHYDLNHAFRPAR